LICEFDIQTSTCNSPHFRKQSTVLLMLVVDVEHSLDLDAALCCVIAVAGVRVLYGL